MGWSKGQNPTGASNPAVRPIPVDPATLTTTIKDQQKLVRKRAGARKIRTGEVNQPISANTQKADGFTSDATSAGQ